MQKQKDTVIQKTVIKLKTITNRDEVFKYTGLKLCYDGEGSNKTDYRVETRIL